MSSAAAPLTIVYVVAGDEAETLLLAHASVATSRRVQPQLPVVLLCWPPLPDSAVVRALKTLVAEIRPVPQPSGQDPAITAREIRMSARALLPGPLLYVDNDTLWVRPFPLALARSERLLAVLDRYEQRPLPAWPSWLDPHFAACGWAHPLPRYYNAGVLLWPDNADQHAFAESWRSRFRFFVARVGRVIDQPAFNVTLASRAAPLHGSLPEACNALFPAAPHLARGAVLWHFFCGKRPGYVLHAFANTFHGEGDLDWALYERARARDWPYLEGKRAQFARYAAYGRHAFRQWRRERVAMLFSRA
jgi:hypothetical protein